MRLQEVGWGGMDWVDLVQGRDSGRPLWMRQWTFGEFLD